MVCITTLLTENARVKHSIIKIEEIIVSTQIVNKANNGMVLNAYLSLAHL